MTTEAKFQDPQQRYKLAAELTELTKSRHFTDAVKLTFKRAAELLQQGPTFHHVNRGSDYEVIFPVAEAQCTAPILEGDKVTVYVALEDGKPWVRPQPEFDEPGRFIPVF